MKLIVDMNLSPRLAGLLREAGFDAQHWSAIGAADAPDRTILAHARAIDAIVVTHDLDFSAILAATGADAPSVVQLRGLDLAPDRLIGPIATALHQCAEALHRGAILTIDTARARLRLLPLDPR